MVSASSNAPLIQDGLPTSCWSGEGGAHRLLQDQRQPQVASSVSTAGRREADDAALDQDTTNPATRKASGMAMASE